MTDKTEPVRSFRKLKIVAGFSLYSLLCARYGAYRGGHKFYQLAQGKEWFLTECAVALLESPLSSMMKDYSFFKENRDNPRLSTTVVKTYSSDSLCGYADWEFTKGGKTVREQQRGLILPLLEKAITECPVNSTVVEIGSGNGDVAAYLAKKFPDKKFIGVDFSVKIAREKHAGIGNLLFIKGYALDLLETGELKGDIVFASSTFTLFTPLELRRYLSLIRHNSFKQVILNEPSFGGLRQENTTEMNSSHMERTMWFHNYCGYLRGAGYSISDFSAFHYKHPLSQRPDITVCLVRAILAGEGKCQN